MTPTDYPRWMRHRFPTLNKSIDDGAIGDLETLCTEAHAATEAIARDFSAAPQDSDDTRERFTYVSMIHAALYRHKRALERDALPPNFQNSLIASESLMIEIAAVIGVEHRFLASFYLLNNPVIEGLHAQFLPGKDEAAFLHTNHLGMLLFKSAAVALLDAAKSMMRDKNEHIIVLKSLEIATNAFLEIVELNRALAQSLDRHEFALMTQYFGVVEVRGVMLRGVNAGDQPWSYIIDLLFGVNLKHVFEMAFDERYPATIKTSADALRYELNHRSYLKQKYLLPEDFDKLAETIDLLTTTESPFILHPSSFILSPLREAIRTYLMTSNTHYGLAKKYVPPDPESGKQIGSSGTNIDIFLKTLIDERRQALDLLG